MVKSLLIGGSVNPASSSFGVTEYWCMSGCSDRGSEALMGRPIYCAGVLSKLQIRISANTLNNTSVFTSRKNSGDGNMSFSVSSGQTGTFQDVTHTDSISSGDLVDIKIDTTACSSGSLSITYTTAIFTPTNANDCVSFWSYEHATGRTTLTGASTRYYQGINGYFDSANTTESISQFRFQISATVKNMRTYVVSNSRTTTTTAEIRKSGVSQSLATSYGSTESLAKSNTSDTVSFVDNDYINFSILNGTGTSAISWGNLSVEVWTSGDPAQCIIVGYSQNLGAQAKATTRYYAFSGYFDALSSEGSTQCEISDDGFTAKNLSCLISANSISGTSTFTLRKNGADTSLQVSISASQSGTLEDVTHSVELVNGDLVNYALVATGTGSQSITLKGYGVHLEASATAGPIAATEVSSKTLTNRFITKV